MAHAHPLSDGPHLPSQQPCYPIYTPSIPCRPPASPRLQDGINQHHRRLQLRNAGFRGPVVPARRVTPFTGNLTPIQEPFTFIHPVNDENSPRSAEKRTLYGEDLPPNPINILQEISNSSRRKRQLPRPGITTTFQDSTTSSAGEEMHTGSWYHEASNESSPSPHRDTPLRMMKLREISLNEKTVPAGSPLTGHDRGKRKPKAKSRASSNESAQYIEHLESEITSLTSKLEVLTSPTKTKAEIAKLRALTHQVRSQREELAEWEKKFEERVSDEVYERTEVDQGLKSRIKALEDEAEVKDAKIRELEWELETMRLKVKEVESLEATNENLGRRVEVLTELLAQSPTRRDFPPLVPTPGSADPTKRTPRPRSLLLPRIPSSPGPRNNSSYSADLVSWHSRNIASISSSSISENPEDEIRSPINSEQGTTALPGQYARPVSIGSGFENAFSSESIFHPSRRTSMTSNYSLNAACGPPVSISSQDDPKSPSRSRKMRRFPSGSCSLKPLILPVAVAVTASLPASAPVYSSSTLLEDISNLSNKSIDPTRAFLSRQDSSPFATPTQAPRRRSETRVEKGPPDTLEGGPCLVAEEDEESQSLLRNPAERRSMDEVRNDGFIVSPIARPQRRSLQMELEQAHKTALEATETAGTPQMSERSGKNVQVETSSASSQPTNIQSQRKLRTPIECNLHRQRPSPRSFISKTPTLVCSSMATPSKSFSNVFPTNTFGMFTKLTGLVSSMKQDPLVLARTILANAWTAGSSSLGGLGWWLLGLIFGSRRPKQDRAANAKLAEEEARSDAFDWTSYTAEASKARRVLFLSQDHHGAFTFSDLHVQQRRPDERDGIAQLPENPASFVTPKPQEGLSTTYPYPLHCENCIEPSSRRTLRLWLRFSLAIVLAVAVAVKDGPETLLEDIKPPSSHAPPAHRRKRHASGSAHATGASSEVTLVPLDSIPQTSIESLPAAPVSPGNSCARNLNDGYWGWEVTSAQNLGPADFATGL